MPIHQQVRELAEVREAAETILSFQYHVEQILFPLKNAHFVTLNYMISAAFGTCSEMSCDGRMSFRCKDGSCLKTNNHRTIGSVSKYVT